ncbi:hypothetical protein HS7_12650 [Sulfolobales archaeon HS-7]|nr:hypothetical protein HS7_12650 [Sulfolobales archaeon HS-7]
MRGLAGLRDLMKPKEKKPKEKEESNITKKSKMVGNDPIVKLMLFLIVISRTRDTVLLLAFLILDVVLAFFLIPIDHFLIAVINNPFYANTIGLAVVAAFVGLIIFEVIASTFRLPEYKRAIEQEVNKLHGIYPVKVAKVLLGTKRFQRLVRWYVKKIEKNVLVAGSYEDMVFKIIDYSATGIDYIPVSVILAAGIFALVNYGLPLIGITLPFPPIMFLIVYGVILSIPALFFFYPYLDTYSKASQARELNLYELPFFAALVAIASSSGLPITYVFRKIRETDVFTAFKMEASAFLRDIMTFGKSMLEVVSKRAELRTSKEYSAFLYGYSAVFTSGGDLEAYLNDKEKEFTQWLALKWMLFSERISSLGEAVVILFLVVPSIFIVLVGLGGTQIINLLLVLPFLFGLALYFMTKGVRPKTPDKVRYNLTIPVALGIALGGILYLTNVPIYLTLYGAVIVPLLLLYVQVRPQLNEIKEVETSLPTMLRDLAEFRKIGYDLSKAIINRSESKTYQPAFTKIIKNIAMQIKRGRTLNNVRVRTVSWLGKFIFFLLGILTESGNISPLLIEEIHSFVTTYVNAKREAEARLRFYKIISIITPALLALTSLITLSLLSSFNSNQIFSGLQGVSTQGLPFLNTQINSSDFNIVYVFIQISSIILGLILNKAITGTIADSKLAMSTVTVSTISIVIFTFIKPALQSAFGFSSSVILALHLLALL